MFYLAGVIIYHQNCLQFKGDCVHIHVYRPLFKAGMQKLTALLKKIQERWKKCKTTQYVQCWQARPNAAGKARRIQYTRAKGALFGRDGQHYKENSPNRRLDNKIDEGQI
jgi:hypothetical protein